VGFKAETGIAPDELVRRASTMLEKYGLDLVVANDVAEKGMGTDDNSVFLVGKDGADTGFTGSKREIAERLFDRIEQLPGLE
jgi:phosphopantothenoylcysteine decarboxylase/phosphopantothenate--cysteine ligase